MLGEKGRECVHRSWDAVTSPKSVLLTASQAETVGTLSWTVPSTSKPQL